MHLEIWDIYHEEDDDDDDGCCKKSGDGYGKLQPLGQDLVIGGQIKSHVCGTVKLK
jgi:hypothetical protein